MSATTPTVAELQALIVTLQTQVSALVAAAPAPAATTAVVFADTPQSLNSDDLVDYSTKKGESIYKEGSKALEDKALTEGFGMTPGQTVVFIEALTRRATAMGWNTGAMQITSHNNADGQAIDVIKCYGQIDEATLKRSCERFCKAGEADAESRAKQNNTMMASCLSQSLTADATARLLIVRHKYTFDGVEYAPLMLKTIMGLATIDSVATTQSLRDNLHALGTFSATVNGDITKIHKEFDSNYQQLLARGATLDDPIGVLFDAYRVVPCYNFTSYMKRKKEDYLDGGITSLTHETLMSMATRTADRLILTGEWGAKSPDDEKIMAMAAEIHTLKGQLKTDKKLGDKLKEGGKKTKKGDSKTKNKKKGGDKAKQKADEEWKKVPPKDGDKKSKEVGKFTYHWCVHHMAWCMHLPADCRLGKERKEEQKKTTPAYVANSATYAAAAASLVNPHFQALIAAMGNLDEEE